MSAARRRTWLSIGGMGLALLGILAFVYAQKEDLDHSDYFENVALLRQLKQLDAQWELDVLKSRMSINTHYDRLADSLRKMTQTLEQFELAMGKREYASNSGLTLSRAALQRALREKSAFIEQFKSANSVLRNSLAFLPTAAEDVQASLRASGERGGPASIRSSASVSRLLLAVVLFSQSASSERGAEIQAQLRQLESDLQFLPSAVGGDINIFSAHIRTVVREQTVVDDLLRNIASEPTAARMEEISEELSKRQKQSAEASRRYREYLVGFAVLLVALLFYAGVQLVRGRAMISRVNRELMIANESLEQRVQERTRELSQAQGQLVATARQAGMAEIATNVLHNVGNVLNGVNISAGLVSTQLRNSKVRGLARAVGLLDEHAEDLGNFLTHDAKGRLLPTYLRELTQAIDVEHEVMGEELSALHRNVDHIKDVIATQQSYAGNLRQVESVELAGLVGDALRMNAGALTRHKVAVVNRVDVLPPLLLDRNRVLLILVNLISNAKQAASEAADISACITLAGTLISGEILRITVADNGEGIAPENLTRIFAHGFTTRKTGHGFGLHSCVLAAQEMGGSLTVHSDGVGRGACFTLDIPVRNEEVQS